jgi:arsenite methyltransferase
MEPERELEIRSSIKSKYREVAVKADGHFPYPTGRASALKLGYDPYWLELVPDEVLERFVGVGNPFSIHMPKPGKRILDAGCGCGMDAFVSSILVGPEGWVSGVDLTTEMLALPLAISAKSEQWNLEFREASIEDLPYESSFFDIVISNGVLNLVPDKKAAFGELARVLKPDGILAVADLLVKETIPQDVISSKDAWST